VTDAEDAPDPHGFRRADPIILPWAEQHGLTWGTDARDFGERRIVIPDRDHGMTLAFGLTDVDGDDAVIGYSLSMSRGRWFRKSERCRLDALPARFDRLLETYHQPGFTDDMERWDFARNGPTRPRSATWWERMKKAL
jgi:hypothetical protein